MQIGNKLSQFLQRVQQIDYQEKSNQELNGYFEKPGSITPADAENIQTLVEKYPFCQLFHAFQALAASEKDFDSTLSKAALYSPDRKTLYTIINNPSNLTTLAIPLIYREINSAEAIQLPEEIIFEVKEDETEIIQETSELNSENNDHEKLVEEEQVELNSDNSELAEIDFLVDEPSSTEESSSEIDTTAESTAILLSEELPAQDVVNENAPMATTFRSEEDKLILGNIASTNFFAIEGSRLDVRSTENTRETRSDSKPLEEEQGNSTEEQVSKYDDDKLPYTFLWWLHKTRKEHAHTYQPYAPPRANKQSSPAVKAEELNHQIIENIFHTQSPAPIAETALQLEQPFSRLGVKNRDEDIIEKFIKEEPQIKPPSPDKLDMENKARRSAEDPNDLVSETLAIIYTEQMLFNKAIDTYRKLIFKYPEKSTYFADQILKLEKKLN
ncbi:MAG: hypothetical protein JWN56_2049 [Sphingobacteriales bacterium]|nr:hypothetical protein [Sphingobacteriales bacterium]